MTSCGTYPPKHQLLRWRPSGAWLSPLRRPRPGVSEGSPAADLVDLVVFLADLTMKNREFHGTVVFENGFGSDSMDWFKGKFTGKPPYLLGKSMVSCRFSLKPIHWLMGFNGTFDVMGYFFMGFSALMVASGNQTLCGWGIPAWKWWFLSWEDPHWGGNNFVPCHGWLPEGKSNYIMFIPCLMYWNVANPMP